MIRPIGAGRSISVGRGRPPVEPQDPPDLPDTPTGVSPPTPVTPVTPVTPIDTGGTGLPTPPVIPFTPYAPPTINTSQYQLPANQGYGDDNQGAGGWGSPYVGTGWNNLSNFLNEGNIRFGQAQEGKPEPMNPSSGRSQSQSAFEDWMWNAGGKTPATNPQNTGRDDGSIPIEPPSWGGGGGRGKPWGGEPDVPPNNMPPNGNGNKPEPFKEPTDPWDNFNKYLGNNRKYNIP